MPSRDPYATDDREERAILTRLGLDTAWGRNLPPSPSEIGVVRPEGQEAVRRLAGRGLVVWAWGDGKDAGVMLVRRPANGRAPRPFPGNPWGGLTA